MRCRRVRGHACTVRLDRLLFCDVRRDWDGLELAAMLLGASTSTGANRDDTSSSNGRVASATLSAGIALGILGCLRDAADQQRLNRGVVTQVIAQTRSCGQSCIIIAYATVRSL